jgi:hypothetical protein
MKYITALVSDEKLSLEVKSMFLKRMHFYKRFTSEADKRAKLFLLLFKANKSYWILSTYPVVFMFNRAILALI